MKDSTNPLVSIIIPVYNEEKYLPFCLESLLSQTYSHLEIIVVDDGSTDKSLEIAKKYNITILRQKHLGAGSARNIGAKKAKGSILVFPDADMRYKANYIEKLIAPIIDKKAIGTFNKDEFVANQENIWARCWSINSDLPSDRHSPAQLPNMQNIFRAIRREYFEKSGGFDPREGYFDDATIAKKLQKFAVAAEGATSYHYNPDSLQEVFYSARWIGRGELYKKSILNLLRFSPINSIRIAYKKIAKNAPYDFIIFKLVYDFGILCGVFLSFGKRSK